MKPVSLTVVAEIPAAYPSAFFLASRLLASCNATLSFLFVHVATPLRSYNGR
jgi:hypothetical protein